MVSQRIQDVDKRLSEFLLGTIVGLSILTIFFSPCFLGEHETTGIAIDFYRSSWNCLLDAIKR